MHSQVRAASSLKVMAYKVTLKTPSGEKTIECADDVYILDAAEEAGELIAAPSSRLFTCSVCPVCRRGGPYWGCDGPIAAPFAQSSWFRASPPPASGTFSYTTTTP